MINLLDATPPRERLIDLLRTRPPRPLLPPLGSPEWSAALDKPLNRPHVRELLRLADAEADQPPPELTDELYRDYAATGRRLPFEERYFARRRQLARAAVALLVEDTPRRAAVFVEKLRAVFAEESWALPAHVSDSSGRDASVIDLFAAETANLMGECLDVFGARMPTDLADAIRLRVHERFFRRYLGEPRFWWLTNTGNWNAVCNQGVLGAALALCDDPGLLADMLLQAARALPLFLSGFGEDGGCSEGPGYWVYGFGWFSVLNEQLETRTGGALSLFAGNDKIRRIASYGPATVLEDNRLANFADCAQTAVLRPSLLAYLGRRLDLPECTAQASANYAWNATHPFDYEGERSDLFHWLRFLLLCPADSAASAPPKGDRYFPDLSVWIVRGRDRDGHLWELAAKGGHNDEHHNHNDVGSFILNVDGVPLVTEIGAPEYVRDFFGPRRYEFLAARSLGHSLPVLNGHEQTAGKERRGHISRSDLAADQVRFVLDYAEAYPPEAACRLARRTLALDKPAGFLRWTDEISLDDAHGPTESALITHAADVTIESPEVALIRRDGLALELRALGDARWTRIEPHPYRGHQGEDLAIRRLVLSPADVSATSLRFEVEIRLRR